MRLRLRKRQELVVAVFAARLVTTVLAVLTGCFIRAIETLLLTMPLTLLLLTFALTFFLHLFLLRSTLRLRRRSGSRGRSWRRRLLFLSRCRRWGRCLCKDAGECRKHRSRGNRRNGPDHTSLLVDAFLPAGPIPRG